MGGRVFASSAPSSLSRHITTLHGHDAYDCWWGLSRVLYRGLYMKKSFFM